MKEILKTCAIAMAGIRRFLKGNKLDAKLLDVCVGQDEFPPDNGSWREWKLTIWRQGNPLVEQIAVGSKSSAAVGIYPESETSFFGQSKIPHEVTFVKNDKGEVTAAVVRILGGLVHEGKKLKSE